MKAVRRIFAVIVGFVFCVAGILKLMDPVGAGLVVEEYLKFLHLGFMLPASKALGLGMSILESLTGAALITGVWRKVTGAVTGVLLGFFTVLTFVLWMKNPEMDCGCFGEAIHLTHLQSLVKNLVLLVFWGIAFIPFRSCGQPPKVKYVSFTIAAISVLLFTLYSTLSIPLMDFTPFKPGVELACENGFADEDSPVLSFSDMEGEYRDSLATKGKVVIVSIYDPAGLNDGDLENISSLFQDAISEGFSPVLLSAGQSATMEKLSACPSLMSNCYFSDRRTLLTLNRSNGGATLISDGQIVRKWAVRSLPEKEYFQDFMAMDATEAMIDGASADRLRMQGFLLYIFAVMLLL